MSKMIIKNPLANNEYLVPVTWECCGFVVAKGNSPEEAFEDVKNNPDNYSLPCERTYVDASFAPTFEDAEMVQVYTDSYNKGQMNILINRDYHELHSEGGKENE